MRRIVFAFLLPIILNSSCEQVNNLTKFNLNYTTSTTIPSGSNLNLPVNIFTPDVETNAESEFAVNDTRKDLIEEIRLTTLTLKISSPTDQKFDFLESIKIYIVAEDLPELRIASKDNISDSVGNTLELETSDEDLKEYIKKDNFILKVNTVTDQVLTQDVDLDISTQFHVDAKILGV